MWTLRDGQRHCARHDETFGLLGTCPRCVDDPGPPPADAPEVPLPDPPEGCESGEEHERRFTELADFAEDLARKAVDTPATVAKLIAEATKARRAAAACAKDREERAWVAALEKRRSKGH